MLLSLTNQRQAGIQVMPDSPALAPLTSLLELASRKPALCDEQPVLVVSAQQSARVAGQESDHSNRNVDVAIAENQRLFQTASAEFKTILRRTKCVFVHRHPLPARPHVGNLRIGYRYDFSSRLRQKTRLRRRLRESLAAH
jgi:hypothetical protein